ncbi:MAG: peptidase M48, partial [Rhodobacteraceae bacterium]|nr:peptidase M48 [Paracoccaceae bacterium]
RAGISPRGLIEVQQIVRGQEALNVGRQDPYVRSHPLTRDRIRAAEAFVAAYGDDVAPRPSDDYWFARAKGKLSAFVRAPKWTWRRVGAEKFQDVRLMREAIAAHRDRNLSLARKKINAAIALRPKDGYYHDLKGQILLESHQINEAIKTYQMATQLAPGEPLILGGYGRALLAAKRYEPALEQLELARARDFRDTRVLRDMSIAYAQLAQPGMASVVTAERYALQGRLQDADIHARRAMRQLPQDSPPWRRAQDVLIAAERATKRR